MLNIGEGDPGQVSDSGALSHRSEDEIVRLGRKKSRVVLETNERGPIIIEGVDHHVDPPEIS